jgi:predicted TIM-barrel fold metal-dependent hydrolase
MALDLADPDVVQQLADGVQLGMRGVKLYPVLAGFDAADPAHDPFYEAATKARLPLLWHVGATPSPVGDLSLSMPLMIDAVARRHPDLVQIMAHLGHPWQREAITVIRKNRNVFSDISASWSRPMEGFHALVRAQEWDVVDKLLFGSDFPLWQPDAAIAGLFELTKLRAGNLPHVNATTIEQILEQNTLRLLGIDESAII